jgi:hypothetical protein
MTARRREHCEFCGDALHISQTEVLHDRSTRAILAIYLDRSRGIRRAPRFAMRLAALAILVSPSLAFAETDVSVNVDVDVKVRTTQPVVIPPPPPLVVVAPVDVNAAPGSGRSGGHVLRGSRWELGMFLEGGRFSADHTVGGQLGARGELARQFGRLRIGIEGSIAKFSGERMPPGTDWWDAEEIGGETSRVGVTVRLRAAGTLSPAPDFPNGMDGAFYVEGGAGKQFIAWNDGGTDERHDFMLGLGLEMAGGKRRMGGFDLNVRAVIAPSLDSSVETHDVSIIAGLGGRFGL